MFFKYRLSRELLVAVASGWDRHVDIINKIIPQAWKVGYLSLIFYDDSSNPFYMHQAVRMFTSSVQMYPYSVYYVAPPFFTKPELVNNHSDAYQKCYDHQGSFPALSLALLEYLLIMT